MSVVVNLLLILVLAVVSCSFSYQIMRGTRGVSKIIRSCQFASRVSRNRFSMPSLYFQPSPPSSSSKLQQSTTEATTASFTYPYVKTIDKEENKATIVVELSGESTQQAFSKSCDLFNEVFNSFCLPGDTPPLINTFIFVTIAAAAAAASKEIKSKGYKVPGFRVGAKLPPMYLYQIFGEDQVKALCGTLLAKEIQVTNLHDR